MISIKSEDARGVAILMLAWWQALEQSAYRAVPTHLIMPETMVFLIESLKNKQRMLMNFCLEFHS